jgi:hypothetical protein
MVALARPPLAARDGPDSTDGYGGFVTFDVLDTLIVQYQHSPVLAALVQYIGAWLDGRCFDDLFFNTVWNLDTAQGWGLDVLGRIVGASRMLTVPEEGVFLGFEGQGTAANLDWGSWYRGADATLNVRLSDAAWRRVILARARANVCGCTIPEINALLMLLFPDYGNSYVVDNADGSMTYRFGAPLSSLDYAIVSQEGILPRPTGIRVTIEQETAA